MRLRFRNLYSNPLSSQSSNRSIILQTYDKYDKEEKRSTEFKKQELSSFQRKIKQEKQSLYQLIEKSEEEKQKYKRRLKQIQKRDVMSTISNSQNITISQFRFNNQYSSKPNTPPILRKKSTTSTKSKENRKSILTPKRKSVYQQDKFSRSQFESERESFQMNDTHSLFKRRQNLEKQLLKLNKSILNRQKASK